ncbi:hypothetical protein HDU76_006449 [Blyttiomyces sp. JEL0837]|nr:hypothetical protein HDU76_006449 [Blyttiomyces sp. JEL0837]
MVQLRLTSRIAEAGSVVLRHADAPETLILALKKVIPATSTSTSTSVSTESSKKKKKKKGNANANVEEEEKENVAPSVSGKLEPTNTTTTKSIDHKDVKAMVSFLRGKYPDRDEYTFDSLVKGSGMVLEAPKPRVKSPELLRILEECRIKQENKEYDEMVKNVQTSKKHMALRLEQDDKEGFRAMIGFFSSIMNVLLSMIAVFVAAFYFGDSVTDDIGMKTLLSLFSALVVGFAEGWFFSRDWLFIDEAPSKKKKGSSVSREVTPAQAPPPISSNETMKEEAQPQNLKEITKKTSQTLRKRNAAATGKRR